jgi:spermidine/putrescine transport system permease protein
MSAVATRAEALPVIERPPLNRPRKRRTRLILPTFTFLMIFYLALPVFVMILYGFNHIPGDRQTAKFWGFTFQWYREVFGFQDLSRALKVSLTVAPISAAISTAMGTLLGLALGRYRFRGKAPTNFVIFLAIAVPEIVLGSSLLSLFLQLRSIPLGYPSILISHISFSVPFVAVTVRARVQGLDRSLEDAAQDPIVAFFKVTLPLIAPAILAGFLLAFVLSLDDFVITNFVSGSTNTFPLWVYGATRIGLPPQVNVMGTLLFSAGILAAIVNVLVQRRRARA